MKRLFFLIANALLFPALGGGGEKETAYLKQKVIPLAQEFLWQIGETNCVPKATNQVRNFKVDYFDDRSGCMAVMRLTNDCIFRLHTEKEKTELWGFQRLIKTSYSLESAPKEKIQAIKSLNLNNKLNTNTALVLARKYFKLLRHNEDNFHPPNIIQSSWSGEDGGGKLPYFEVSWYRKDVDLADREKGIASLPEVEITVSGIDSSLLYYSRLYLPMGSDF